MGVTKRSDWEGLTVPAAAAWLVDRRLVSAPMLVMVGERVEVDLARAAEELGVDVASAAATYWSTTRRAAAGGQGGVLTVCTRRLLVDARQDTGRGKRDLGALLWEIDLHPLLGPLAKALLVPEVPAAHEVRRVGGADAAVAVGDRTVAVTVPVTAPGWPRELGAAPLPNEVRRWFRLESRHAPWRDRRARRLARVTIWAEERWPGI